MYKITLAVCLVAGVISVVSGQPSSASDIDGQRIVLTAYIPDNPALPTAGNTLLAARMDQILTRHGLGGTSSSSQFVLVARPLVLDKQITGTAPPRHVYSLQISFFVGDGVGGILFSSTSLALKGVGDTEEKAYLAALRNLNPQDERFNQLLELGKEKIIAHYEAQCPFILKKAQSLAARQEYDAALALLSEVPTVSSACFDSAQQISVRVFNAKWERECQQHITAAKALIAEGNWDEAARPLIWCTPDMSCYPEVDKILKEISAHSQFLEKWQRDKVAKEFDLERARVQAIRDIGVAYGQNQPRQIIYHVDSWH